MAERLRARKRVCTCVVVCGVCACAVCVQRMCLECGSVVSVAATCVLCVFALYSVCARVCKALCLWVRRVRIFF